MSQKVLYFEKNAFSPRYGRNFFTFELKSSFLKTAKDSCNCTEVDVVFYTFQLRRGTVDWILEKRFSDFERLQNDLILFQKSCMELSGAQLPALPPKTWFRVLDDAEFIKQRGHNLFQLLEGYCKLLSHHKLVDGSPLEDFLELNR